MFEFIFRKLVVLRHNVTGWYPPYNERYYWFYYDGAEADEPIPKEYLEDYELEEWDD